MMQNKPELVAGILEKINELRKAKGWSCNMLAKQAQIPQATIKSIMNGESKNPTIYTLYKIAWALDVPVAELLKS